MKKMKLFLLGLIVSLSPFARSDNATHQVTPIIQYLAQNQGIKNFAFYSLIAKRCSDFLVTDFDIYGCQEGVDRMIELLDSEIYFPPETGAEKSIYTPREFLFIAFKKNLIQTLSDENTTIYLNDLQSKLNGYLLGMEKEFNLWDFSLNYFQSPLETSKAISALFQDTSSTKLHLAYLEKLQVRGKLNFNLNKELLNRTIDVINIVSDYSDSRYHELFYPKSVKSGMNKSLYHFYVPLHLAMKLKHEGFSKHVASAAPFMMTLTYEFITAANDYRYLFRNPQTIPNEWKARDIFGGLQGSMMGSGKKNLKDFEFLKTGLTSSTTETVRAILNF
jgi:hypothetical protein